MAILVENIEGLTVDGGGSTFVFHDRIQPFTIDRSSSVTIRDLSIDWDIPLTAEAEDPAVRFAVCVRNAGYEASLERNKIYVVLPDDEAERDGDLRVVDESGEDYLFSADRFVAVDVPAAVKASLLKTA